MHLGTGTSPKTEHGTRKLDLLCCGAHENGTPTNETSGMKGDARGRLQPLIQQAADVPTNRPVSVMIHFLAFLFYQQLWHQWSRSTSMAIIVLLHVVFLECGLLRKLTGCHTVSWNRMA